MLLLFQTRENKRTVILQTLQCLGWMKYDIEILSNSISEKNECFARLPSNHMLSKANTQVKWCLQLCMPKIQGGHPERSTHFSKCHLQCRSRWNYSPQRSTEKASIWYLSCLLWKTNYKWHGCLAEPMLTIRGARWALHNCTDCSSGACRDC